MKYVNHMTIAGEDGKIQALRDAHGLAGYGAYWLVVEKIAVQIRPESMSTSLCIALRKWAKHLDVPPKWTRKFLKTCHDLQLFTVSEQGNLITIDAPNILKYCDEYSKKVRRESGRPPEKVRSDTGFPALPALPDIQALPKNPESGAALGGGKAAAPAPKPIPKSDLCQFVGGCKRRGTARVEGRWYCSEHHPGFPGEAAGNAI